MSETSSDSPSVLIHPISPSSSLSSNNSEPHSDPTSDEQPDLGAFNAVLREWTHLQPPPRIPVQIRSATSSTTPTFQPSLTGSEPRSERSRNTRVSGISGISSFTRPPSSSAHPEGSTVWAHAPIASYLYSGTPSNDADDDDDGESYEIPEGEGEYTPNSMASTSLTVEIESETDFDESNGRVESSPYPFPSESGVSGVSMLVPLQTEVARVDSREPEHLEDELETSETSRDRTYDTITAIRSLGDTESESRMTSMQLQSQVRPTPTTASLSSATAAPSVSSLASHSPPVYPQNRGRNPLPPRTTSDSSYTTSGSASSSDFSLISYQISEAPSMPIVEESSSANVSGDSSSVSASASMGLKTQRSMPTTSSESTVSLGTQRPPQTLQQTLQQPLHPEVPSSDASAMSSTGSPLPNPHPLPNPYSPLSIPASIPSVSPSHIRRSMLANVWRQDIVVDDLGTPDQPPSETLLFNPPRERKPEFHPIIDDDEEDIKVERIAIHERNDSANLQSILSAGYAAGYDRPGVPTSTQGNTYRQAHDYSQRIDRREPHNEDDDEFNLEEDEHYRSRYPYSHGLAPRSFGPALTPKGIPSSSIDSRHQAPTQPTTNTNSFVQPFQYSTQSLLQTSQQSQSQQTEQFLPMHSSSLVQPQSQYHYQTNQLQSASYTTSTTSMPQSTNQPSLPPSYPYTPRAAIPTQSSNAYTSQSMYSASTSQYSYPQDQAQAHTEPATNPHGYPYSLLGFHALPATFVPPEADELPSTSSSNIHARGTTSQIPPRAQTHRRASSDPYNASFSDDNSTVRGVEPTTHMEPEMESILLEQAVPSLGVLDGVLSFIAVERERVRNIAAREASSTADVEDFRDTGSGDDGEAEVAEGETLEGEEDWKHVVENEPNQPKRKRRRKRPPRSHAAAAAQALIAAGGAEASSSPPNTTGVEGAVDLPVSILAAVTASPKRKKKTKSRAASVSASTSSSSRLSVPLHGDGLQTPTPNKEFLLPPPSLSRSASKNRPAFASLRRPDELLIRSNIPSDDDDSDFDGGRTPTNFDILRAEASRETEVLPINLNGKKGKRVGRREREREKARHDAINAEQGSKEGDSVDMSVEDNSFEFDFDDDDNDDDGLEPRDEDEEQGEDNDSLSNLSLLKPPRRRRDRSRRRKGRDTTYIHTVTGINGAYKSTPGTPGGHLQPSAIANDGDEQLSAEVEIKQSSVEEDDVFEPKSNTTPEKRKRTRTKRLKPARSFPDMNVNTLAGGSTAPALAPSPVVEDRTQLAVMKATKGRVGAAELLGSHDVLDMDRNQLQKYLIASGSGIILMNSPPEPKNQPPPDSKRGRLLSLARQLRELFPEQYDDLGRIIQRIEKAGATQGKARKTVSSDAKEDLDTHHGTSRPISIPGPKRKRSRKGGHARTGSEGGTTGGDGFDHDDEQLDDPQNADGGAGLDIEEEEEEVDPRGRPPKRSDALVHVFIDHSNILIGLLSHLKRHQAYRKNALNKARSRPLPALISKATAATRASNQTDAASAFAAVKASSSRPLPVPSNGETNTNSSSQTITVPLEAHPIPLPSFATMTRSLPTTSALSAYMAARNNGEHSDDATGQPEREATSDGYEYPAHIHADNDQSGAGDDSTSLEPTKNGKEKRVPRHLWHAALALILERGRPVTRRVVVTSSPLYQPMDAIERLGYELRVFIRVPDLGDGQDRERYRDKDKLGSGKSSGSAKSTQSSPATTTSPSGLPLLSRKSKSIGHVRQISGNTSTESGSGGGAGSGNASGGNLHPYYGITNSASQTRVKFREQGVDELLQLKLHQAIAATDDVPEGSTIVLATGDGNMGQFNEDGFLGPVRTALRRGWKVELYAWEDGLSRAWKREFGAGSDWGRRDLFRVIGMEQFAHVLVEAVEHMSN